MRVTSLNEINLKRIVILFFTFFIVTEFIYISIFNSITLEIIIMSGFLFVLMLHAIIIKRPIYIQRIDFYYILAVVMVIFSLRSLSGEAILFIKITEVIIFGLIIAICYFIRGDIKNYLGTFKVLKISGIILSLSVIFSWMFPSFYGTIVNMIFRPEIARRIIESMNQGYYIGFTSEVSITAGIIIIAIGYIYVEHTVKEEKYTLKDIIILSLLVIGLLFTQKRAHLLFMLLTVFVVHIHYIKFQGDFIRKTIKKMLYLLGITGLFAIILELIGLREVIFQRFRATFEAFKAGEDITSNRIVLYEHAIQLFKEFPLLGIGWENFRDTLIGNVTVHTKMQVHNIYLQLLAETGLVGATIILLPFIVTLIITLKISKRLLLNAKNNFIDWKIGVLFSLYIQIFFLLYGFTGNPLYDNFYLFIYFIGASIIFSYKIYEKQIITKSENVA